MSLDAMDDALVGFRNVLREQAVQIELHLPGVCSGDGGPEALHELRIAVRRTRSVLAEAKGVVPEDIRRRHRAAFGELGRLTSPTRDLDVVIAGWTELIAPLPAQDQHLLQALEGRLASRREAARRAMATGLREHADHGTLAAWQAWLDDPTVAATDPRPLGPLIAKRIAKAQSRLLRDGRAIAADSPAERLHDLRKDAKKLRYLFECFGDLLDPKPRKAFVTQLRSVQDNLGEHQDAAAQEVLLRELVEDPDAPPLEVGAAIAVGRLIGELDRRRLAERAAFAACFDAYDSRANRKALRRLLRPLGGDD